MHHFLLWINCILAFVSISAAEPQIKWIPNDSDEGAASLPLSMKQRQQLKQLEAALHSSPDPEGTLSKIAAANNLSPQELMNLMVKNSRDLDQDPALAKATTIPRAAMKAVAAVGVIVSQFARNHPRCFTVSILALSLLLYASFEIPRTGLQLSRRRSLMWRGPTCVFNPPQSYLQELADNPGTENDVSIQTKALQFEDLIIEQDGVVVHSLRRKSPFKQAFSARQSVSAESLLCKLDIEDGNEIDNEARQEELAKILFESSTRLLLNRGFTESPSKSPILRVVFSSNTRKHGILVVPGLGSFDRFGLVHWQVMHEMKSGTQSSLTMTTVVGKGFFDAQLHIRSERFGSTVVLTAHLVVPQNGRKIRESIAIGILEEIAESIASSTMHRGQQTLVRSIQGKRFKSASHHRAGERRSQRHLREKLIEEMSEDRRRKWQRDNQDGGRWRPSGKRLQSPNNC
eukprot:scaffold22577_cov122-Cylindrotheca_fusiformis.AAC.50